MKNWLSLNILLLIPIFGYSQNVPVSPVTTVGVPVPLPAPYIQASSNFIRTWEPSVPSTDKGYVSADNRTIAEVKQNTQYFDDFGTPLQMVVKGISPLGYDLVSPLVNDSFGREIFNYIPYVQLSGNTNDGKFKLNPFAIQASFYQNEQLNPGAVGERVYYTRTDYERSPLNRIARTYDPGNTWAKNDAATGEQGGNKFTAYQYLANTVTDSVRIWNVADDVISSPGTYAEGELQKNVTINEAGNQKIEYTDKQDRVILSKLQLDNTPAGAHAGWQCVYYIYDIYGKLRATLTPGAVNEIMINNWQLSADNIKLCFQYKYDSRNRVITQTMPDGGTTYLVYDIRDRVAFKQTEEQRNKSPQEWIALFYDDQNRPIMTALYYATVTREALQASMNAVTSGSQNLSYSFPLQADLAVDNYDGVTNHYTATNSIVFLPEFSTPGNMEITGEISSSGNAGTTSIAANNALPSISSSSITPLTYTFYDNYTFTGAAGYNAADITKVQAGNNPYAEALPSSPSKLTKGLVTGTKIRVIGTDQWLTTTTYYDDRNRPIQAISDNVMGGTDRVTTLYNFEGKVLSNYLRHTNPRSALTPTTTVLTMIAFDFAGRVINVQKKVNEGPLVTISESAYNESGKINLKRLGVIDASKQLETISTEYNLRGWITGLNKKYITSTSQFSNWFGEEVDFDKGFSYPAVTSDISGVKWRSAGDGTARAYGYTYDNISRLLGADFTQQTSFGGEWEHNDVNYTVSGLRYDANGNIISMKQSGLEGAKSKPIDDLVYQYLPHSNRLNFVTDKVNDYGTKLGDFREKENGEFKDYEYDLNGNLLSDRNKGITAITYNFLNLPTSIVVDGNKKVNYTYGATGTKLQKTVTDESGNTETTDYDGAFTYERDSLRIIGHEEGRIRPVYKKDRALTFTYDYFEKDHLGNIRAILGTERDTVLYAATMEQANAEIENLTFSNIDNTRKLISEIQGYPADPTTNPNVYVARLNAQNGQKIGPSIVLRVMAGDTIQSSVKAFYKDAGASTSNSTGEEMVQALLQAFNGHAGVADGVHSAVGSTSPIALGFDGSSYSSLLQSNPQENLADKPKAYLSYALFDDQFNMVNDNSGVKQVQGSPGELQELGTGKIIIQKTGFIYIYTNNESYQDVYFDNLVVMHNNGPLLETTHYYPFGLEMAAISSVALRGNQYTRNLNKFQGQLKEPAHDLNIYTFKWRTEDPQTGRFMQVDPLTDKYVANSPYAFSENRVTGSVELEGLETFTVLDGINRPTTIHGLFPNQAMAQQYYDTYYTTKGTPLCVSADGFIQSPRVHIYHVTEMEHNNIGQVKAIVLHRTVSTNLKGTMDGFKVPRHDGVIYGAHFTVAADGTIYQNGSLNKFIYHAGPSYKPYTKMFGNSTSIGIEVMGMHYGSEKTGDGRWDPVSPAQARSVAWLTNSLVQYYNLTTDKVYAHEWLREKTAGEGSVVLGAISNELISPLELNEFAPSKNPYFWDFNNYFKQQGNHNNYNNRNTNGGNPLDNSPLMRDVIHFQVDASDFSISM